MKSLFDFFPIVLFFIFYKMYDIFVATEVMIVSCFIQMMFHRKVKGFYDKMHLVTFFSVFILGGLTVFLKDENFIKFKPTIVYWITSAVLLFNHIFSEKTVFEHLVSDIKLPKDVWRKMNLSWCVFLAIMGGLNLFVMYNFSTDIWVQFKLFGTMVLTFIFLILQTFYIIRRTAKQQD